MRLGRALFVLPTLFTLTSVLMGVISLAAAAQGDFRLSALTIFFAILFDSIDGGVARLTRTQSKFGVQIDSLADVISFGVAPALLVYLSLLKGAFIGRGFDWGLAIAFVYLGTGAIRLARYNVDSDRKPGPVRTFIGLPIPAGAGCLAGLVLGLVKEGTVLTAPMATIFMLLLSFLMVSRVRFRKKINLRDPAVAVQLVFLAVTVGATMLIRPAFAAFSFFACYTAFGVAESTLSRLFKPLRNHFPFTRRSRSNDKIKRKLRR
jgi:CDP-diacylglycerol---serine O-phosphatidyltransferase